MRARCHRRHLRIRHGLHGLRATLHAAALPAAALAAGGAAAVASAARTAAAKPLAAATEPLAATSDPLAATADPLARRRRPPRRRRRARRRRRRARCRRRRRRARRRRRPRPRRRRRLHSQTFATDSCATLQVPPSPLTADLPGAGMFGGQTHTPTILVCAGRWPMPVAPTDRSRRASLTWAARRHTAPLQHERHYYAFLWLLVQCQSDCVRLTLHDHRSSKCARPRGAPTSVCAGTAACGSCLHGSSYASLRGRHEADTWTMYNRTRGTCNSDFVRMAEPRTRAVAPEPLSCES